MITKARFLYRSQMGGITECSASGIVNERPAAVRHPQSVWAAPGAADRAARPHDDTVSIIDRDAPVGLHAQRAWIRVAAAGAAGPHQRAALVVVKGQSAVCLQCQIRQATSRRAEPLAGVQRRCLAPCSRAHDRKERRSESARLAAPDLCDPPEIVIRVAEQPGQCMPYRTARPAVRRGDGVVPIARG